MASLIKARWTKAASMVAPPKKKMSFLDAVKKMNARQRACMDVAEREFHAKLTKGPLGPKLEKESDMFATELCNDCLDPVHRADREDIHEAVVKIMKNMQEAIILITFSSILQDDKALASYKKKLENIKKTISESQRNYMLEMVQLKEMMNRATGDDEEEDSNRVGDILLYDGLMSLDEELREICDVIIEKRILKALKSPKRVLLQNIQKLLNEGEAAIEGKGVLSATGGGPSPMVSPRSAKKTPAEVVEERDKTRIQELEVKLQALEANLALANQEFVERRNQRNRLERQCATVKTDHETESEELHKRIADAAEGAIQQQADLEKLLKSIREERRKLMQELNLEIAGLRREYGAAKENEASQKTNVDDKEVELARLKAELSSKQLSYGSNVAQVKEVKDEIENLRKEMTKIEGILPGLQERERFLREKLTVPLAPAPKEERKGSKTVVKDDDSRRGTKSLERRTLVAEEEPEIRGAWLKDLLAVLRAQMLLSTPRDGQSRDWGRPLDGHALVAPTGDKDLAKIVAILNGEESTGWDNHGASGLEEGLPYHKRLCRGAPSAKSGRGAYNPDQYWLLAPATVGSIDEIKQSPGSIGTPGLGQSRSCPDFNGTSQSWATSASDSKTVSVRVLDKPLRRGWLKGNGGADPRPQSTASSAGKRMVKEIAPLGTHKCSLCGHGGGTVQCLECQTTVPRLSVGWCLPPLAIEQNAKSK